MGIYNYLPLMWRVIKKVENIIREEMNRAGAQELLMPFVQPKELWEESGRWGAYGGELMRLTDRHGREMCLGPTHEEIITAIARDGLKSYKQLPVNLYQIQSKFRDERRPRFGLLRGREFIMKDAYSFDVDQEGLEKEYKNMWNAYTKIFKRCGLETKAVQSDSGAIGGSVSHEFMVITDTDAGENDRCGNRCRPGERISPLLDLNKRLFGYADGLGHLLLGKVKLSPYELDLAVHYRYKLCSFHSVPLQNNIRTLTA